MKNQKIHKKRNNFISKNQDSLWICGKHPVFLALAKKRRKFFQILVTKNSLNEVENFLTKNNLLNFKNIIKIVDNFYIDSILENQVHQGVALNCSFLPIQSQNDLLQNIELIKAENSAQKKLPTLLILDQLTDPHNIGAIIRSACAFGVKHIIFPEHNFAKESAIVNKSSSGMIENVELFSVININNLLEKLKEIGYWCIGLAGEAKEDVSAIKNYPNVALIVGSEGSGIRQLVKKNCDLLVKIKMNNEVESLNASVAAAIALYNTILTSK